jgi:hypothetical protein
MARLIRVPLNISLATLLVLTIGPVCPAKSKIEWQTYSPAQLKAAMSTLGVGEHARVIVTLQDGTRLSGYVSQANDTRFMVVGKGEATPVEYGRVADIRAGNPDTQVKFAARLTTEAAALAAQTPPPAKPRHGHQRLSNAAKAALVLAVTAAGIVATLAFVGAL